MAAVFLVAGCTLALQVVLTRVFSAALFYHFGFLAISLALVGTGGAAMIVYLRPSWFAPPRRLSSLAAWAAILAVSLVVVPAVLVRLDYTFEDSITLRFALTLGAASLLSAVPFVAAGTFITLTISRYTQAIHRVYAFDLVGAGLGALLIVPALWKVPAPLLAAALGLVAALAVLLAGDSREWRVTGFAVAGLAALAVVLGATTSLYHLPTTFPDNDDVADRWTPLSRVVAYSSTPNADFAVLTYDRDYAPVPRHRPGTPFPNWRELKLGPQSVGLDLAPRDRVLVIGGGGGRDIYNALSAGARRVDVIELNRGIRSVVDDDLAPKFGSAYELPRVHVEIGDGRSTLARRDTRYGEINIGFTNTLSGNAAQGAALTENNLYTVEAVNEYLDHLAPRGILALSRIERLVGDEALRATVLIQKALEQRGIEHPERNIVVLLGRDQLTNLRFGTILTRLTPFTPAELERIRRLATERGEGVAYADGKANVDGWRQLAKASSLESFCSDWVVDICPPTDDRPFFLNFERVRDIGKSPPPGYLFTIKPFSVLLIALAILAVLCIAAFVVPLALVARAERPPVRSLVFFAAIGVGFLVLEVAMIQRFVLFLGFPTYSLSVVLASLLLFTGVGAAASARWGDPRRALSIALSVAVALILAAAFVLPSLLHDLIDLPFAVRICLTAAILAPFGLTLGMGMPLGLSRIAALHPGSVAWAWGINGVTSVLAAVLAISVAIIWGFTVATLVAAACYAIAAGDAIFGAWPDTR